VTDPTPEAMQAAKRIPLGYGTFEDQRLAAARIIDEAMELERAAAKRLREAMTKIAETTRKPGSAGEHTWYATVRKLQEIAREALNPTKRR
jgi:hypothetical protein